MNQTAVDIPYPSQTNNYHYEIELVVAIAKDGKDISVEDAKGLYLWLCGRSGHDPS